MKTKSQKTNKGIEQEEFVLIKGEFSPDDALEITNDLINKKINFHKLKVFSSEIRFGYLEDKVSASRIEELRQSKDAINRVIALAQKEGKQLNIYSTITIQLI